MQSTIQSTCCSIETIMLLRTEGLPGPVTVKRFGKPAIVRPSAERGPAAHFSRSDRPSRPRRSIASRAPVIASKPVPSTIVSSANSSSPTRRPRSLISSIGRSRIETSRTLSRL